MRLKRDQLASAVFQAFLSTDRAAGTNSGLFRSPLVQLWSFNRQFIGDNADLMSRGLPVYMQEDVSSSMRDLMFARRGSRSRVGDSSGQIDRQRSIGSGNRVSWDAQLTAMQQNSLSDFDIGADPDLYRAVLDTKGLTMFRVVEAVVGSGAFTNALESFGNATAYSDVSFDQFGEVVVPDAAGDGGNDLTELIEDWINGTQVPGYTITYAETFKHESEWGAVDHRVVARLRNGEPGRGFAQVRVVGDDDSVSRNIQINGGEEIEVSVVMRARPERLIVEPFLAKNRRPLNLPLRVPDVISAGAAEQYVRRVVGEEIVRGEVIIDNEDAGFSMPLRRVQRYLRPQLAAADWRVRYSSYSNGLYETNYRWRPSGDGSQPAVWTAELPFDGEYDVAYYHLPRRLNGVFIRWQPAQHFTLTVIHADGESKINLDYDRLEPGWNSLGRFRFAAGTPGVVELSDDADGYLYADGMRWRYLDPATAGAEYFDRIAPWERTRAGGSQ